MLAGKEPRLSYQPNQKNWRDLRAENPASFWRQALVLGHLDRLTEAMVVAGAAGRQVISFGHFEKRIRSDPEFQGIFKSALDLFTHFDFDNRPVLARVLLVQALLHRLILYTYTPKGDMASLDSALQRFVESSEFRQDLVWWPNDAVSAAPAVTAYVQERVRWISQDEYAIDDSETKEPRLGLR